MNILSGKLTLQPDGGIAGALNLQPDQGELDRWYKHYEKILPAALQGIDGLYLAADGVRAKGRKLGVPFDVTVSLKAEGG
jgi:hypothetical protein